MTYFNDHILGLSFVYLLLLTIWSCFDLADTL